MTTTIIQLHVPFAQTRQVIALTIKLDEASLLQSLSSRHNAPHFDVNRVDKSVWYERSPHQATVYVTHLLRNCQPHLVDVNINKKAATGSMLLFYDDNNSEYIGHVNSRRGTTNFDDCRLSNTVELRLKPNKYRDSEFEVVMAYPSLRSAQKWTRDLINDLTRPVLVSYQTLQPKSENCITSVCGQFQSEQSFSAQQNSYQHKPSRRPLSIL